MREEVILALDLYLNRDGLHDLDARRELSGLLRAWPVQPEAAANPAFRNPTSVRNKLYNLQFLDTDGAQGRENAGAATVAVWEEFAGDAHSVAAEAAVIRAAMQDLETEDEVRDDLAEDETSVVLITHRRRERSRALVEAKKAAALTETGGLACEACGFDSGALYDAPGVMSATT